MVLSALQLQRLELSCDCRITLLAVVAFGGLPCSELLLQGGLFFLGIFSRFFLGIFSRFLVEGRCEEGRKEGMGEGSKKNK